MQRLQLLSRPDSRNPIGMATSCAKGLQEPRGRIGRMSLVVNERDLAPPIPLSSCLPRCIRLFATWCTIAVDPSRRRAEDFRLSPLASLCEATFSLGVVLLSPKLLLTQSPSTTFRSLVGLLACCLSPHFFLA
jgi:hypothetical protein